MAFFGNTCHAADIGGRGLSADAREVDQEGLYLPDPQALSSRHAERRRFSDHSRQRAVPREVLGDIHAQVACNEVAGRRLLEFLEEFGFDTIEPISAEILAPLRTGHARGDPADS